MHLTCRLSQALFPLAGFKVWNDKPLPLLWDCHHGDTFVMLVKGLQVEPLPAKAPSEPPTLELGLADDPEVPSKIETFAAHHNLGLTSWSTLPESLEEPLTLAACHLPGPKLFVFSEKATLTAKATPEGNLRLIVNGDFMSKKVPCQEADLVLHLERPHSSRLLSFCFAIVRGRR